MDNDIALSATGVANSGEADAAVKSPDVPAICADDVARLRKALTDATSGPWRMEHGAINAHIHQVDGLHWLAHCVIGHDSWHSPQESRGVKDAILIVAAVNALPALLDTIERQGELMKRVRTSMALLQQNSEGCAINHYGGDHQMLGMPGWLVDTRADLDALTASVAHLLKEQQP